MFQFELHPHTGEIRTEILVYDKGGLIKHVEACHTMAASAPALSGGNRR